MSKITKESIANQALRMEHEAMKRELAELKANKAKVTVLPTIKARSELPTTVSYDSYKGNDLIQLLKGESSFINKPFSFGKAKAQMIVEQYAAIKKFAESK